MPKWIGRQLLTSAVLEVLLINEDPHQTGWNLIKKKSFSSKRSKLFALGFCFCNHLRSFLNWVSSFLDKIGSDDRRSSTWTVKICILKSNPLSETLREHAKVYVIYQAKKSLYNKIEIEFLSFLKLIYIY